MKLTLYRFGIAGECGVGQMVCLWPHSRREPNQQQPKPEWILTTPDFGLKLRYRITFLNLGSFFMPDRPMPAPESGPESRAGFGPPLPGDAPAPPASPSVEADIAALAARLAAYGGGNFSPEFSEELELESVLHEIVEQACLATGATGAAILLGRDGEMICRARCGTTIRELGAKLEEGSSFAQACRITREVQKCDDIQANPGVDTEAARRLGIRAVIVLPLLCGARMAGLLEAFSVRDAAFGERDQRTLEALAHRALQTMERVRAPSDQLQPAKEVLLPSFSSADHAIPSDHAIPPADAEPDLGAEDEAAGKTAVGRGLQILTWALGLTVLAGAVLLGILVMQKLGWRRHELANNATAGTAKSQVEPQAGSVAQEGSRAAPFSATPSPEPFADRRGGQAGATSSAPPGFHRPESSDSDSAGALTVYENGREVFRVPPQGQVEPPEDTAGSVVKQASSVEPADTMELSTSAAEDGLALRVEPDYPEEARRQRIQGAVVLDVHIRRDGSVQEVRVVEGPALLARAAIDAVKQWRFKTRSANGHLVEMQTRVTLNFRLPQ